MNEDLNLCYSHLYKEKFFGLASDEESNSDPELYVLEQESKLDTLVKELDSYLSRSHRQESAGSCESKTESTAPVDDDVVFLQDVVVKVLKPPSSKFDYMRK